MTSSVDDRSVPDTLRPPYLYRPFGACSLLELRTWVPVLLARLDKARSLGSAKKHLGEIVGTVAAGLKRFGPTAWDGAARIVVGPDGTIGEGHCVVQINDGLSVGVQLPRRAGVVLGGIGDLACGTRRGIPVGSAPRRARGSRPWVEPADAAVDETGPAPAGGRP